MRKLFYITFLLLWFIKLSSQTTLFHKTYGISGSYANCIEQTQDNGYIVSGAIRGSSGYGNGFLTKIDSLGNSQWLKKYDKIINCQQVFLNRKGFLITGPFITPTPGSTMSFCIIQTDSAGNVLWSKKIDSLQPPIVVKPAAITANKELVITGSKEIGRAHV